MSWEARWQAGQTPWDLGGSPPVLEARAESLPGGRVLVPGCGAGWDVLTLARPDREVVGLDLSPTARRLFERIRAERGIPPERARVETGDFFSFEPEAPFDLVFDYTFFCALPPERREAWAEKMYRLLRPGGTLITLVFPVREPKWPPRGCDPEAGPPFPVHPDLYRAHLAPFFEEEEMSKVTHSAPGREGKEWWGRWRRREAVARRG
ncbi:MAG: methyltransferase domain-containing protein [Deltaproteobacteria bacterium]|nr:MAG: methyltransferase domain-containing protein [Deltaproteobacteria bacterium]